MENVQIGHLSTRDYARVIFKRIGLVFFIFSLSMLCVGLYSYLVLPTYEAKAQILITAQKNTPIPMTERLSTLRQGVEIAATQSEIIKSTSILAEVVQALDLANRPDPTGIRGRIKVRLDEIREYFLNLKEEIKSKLIALVLGQKSIGAKKEISNFDLEVRNLASKKVVRIEPLDRTDIINIVARDYDPDMAAKIANAIAQAYVIYDMETQLKDLSKVYRPEHPKIASLEEDIQKGKETLKSGLNEPLQALAGRTSSGDVKIIQKATPSVTPIAPRKGLNLLLAALASLIASLAYIFALEMMDGLVRNPAEAQSLLRTKALGSIPVVNRSGKGKSKPILAADLNGKRALFTDSISSIASEVILLNQENNVKALMVVSSDKGDGKTTLAANLALTIWEITRKKVLLVNADLREAGTVDKLLGVDGKKGFIHLPDVEVNLKDVTHFGNLKKVQIVPAGGMISRPESVLASSDIKRFFEEAKNQFDYIIVDTPDLGSSKDAYLLASNVDGALFVVHAGNTRRHQVQVFRETLAEKKLPVMGAVLNFREFFIPESVYRRL